MDAWRGWAIFLRAPADTESNTFTDSGSTNAIPDSVPDTCSDASDRVFVSFTASVRAWLKPQE